MSTTKQDRAFDATKTLSGVLALAGALVCTSASASAYNLVDRLWPATSAELGAPNWDGFYVNPDFSFSNFSVNGTAASGFDDLEGHLLGGQIGYDYTIGNFLIGGVIQGGWGTNSSDGQGALTSFEADLKSLGVFRARLGYTFDRFLIYGTGGLAVSEVRVNGFGARQEETLTGWTAGGGIEYAWNRGASIRFEYQRLELDESTFSNLPAGSNSLGVDGHLFDFGFVRRF